MRFEYIRKQSLVCNCHLLFVAVIVVFDRHFLIQLQSEGK